MYLDIDDNHLFFVQKSHPLKSFFFIIQTHQNSLIHQTLCKQRHDNEDGNRLAVQRQLEFLSVTTKNQPFRVKDETSNAVLKDIITSSPK